MRFNPTVGLLLNYRDSVRSIACVRSLLAQPIDHVFIWDNSADGGASASEIEAIFPAASGVVIEISEGNLGFSRGVNTALQRIKDQFPSAWVLLINNDARIFPGGLAKLVDLLSVHEDAEIASPRIDHGGNPLGLVYYHRLTGALCRRNAAGTFPYASGCCLLIATDRTRTPVFDEAFFMYGEDIELGWRLHQRPGALVHLPEVLVQHEGSASSGLGSMFYEERMVAAHLTLAFRMSRHRLDAVFLLAVRTPMLLTRAAVRSVRFRSWVPWRALWHGARIAAGKDPKRLL